MATGLIASVGLLMALLLPRIRTATEASQVALGEMGSRLERAFGAFRTVKASSAERREIERLDESAVRSWRNGVAVAGRTAASGTVLLDGEDVRGLPPDLLRAQIGQVEQDAPVLDGTLRENPVMAAPYADEGDVADVVRRARLEDLVSRLPQGLDGEIGHRGVTLSGGERQRVTIARALLRAPRLLLMDEATSQLDAANETALKEVMLEASRTTRRRRPPPVHGHHGRADRRHGRRKGPQRRYPHRTPRTGRPLPGPRRRTAAHLRPRLTTMTKVRGDSFLSPVSPAVRRSLA